MPNSSRRMLPSCDPSIRSWPHNRSRPKPIVWPRRSLLPRIAGPWHGARTKSSSRSSMRRLPTLFLLRLHPPTRHARASPISTTSDTPSDPGDPNDKSLASPESVFPDGPQEYEELSQVFEAFLMSRERNETGSAPQLTSEQLPQVLKQQADREQREFDMRVQRDRQRHELAILKQQDKSAGAARDGQLKNATLTYLPRLAVVLVGRRVGGCSADRGASSRVRGEGTNSRHPRVRIRIGRGCPSRVRRRIRLRENHLANTAKIRQ